MKQSRVGSENLEGREDGRAVNEINKQVPVAAQNGVMPKDFFLDSNLTL